MAKGIELFEFEVVDMKQTQFQELSEAIAKMITRLDRIKLSVVRMDNRMIRLEDRLERIENKLNRPGKATPPGRNT